jgi:hypothetical protein
MVDNGSTVGSVLWVNSRVSSMGACTACWPYEQLNCELISELKSKNSNGGRGGWVGINFRVL